ncbi:MAG: hypothetical protein ACTSPV_16915 [Candidatus Hodarchaeales archaeon]
MRVLIITGICILLVAFVFGSFSIKAIVENEYSFVSSGWYKQPFKLSFFTSYKLTDLWKYGYIEVYGEIYTKDYFNSAGLDFGINLAKNFFIPLSVWEPIGIDILIATGIKADFVQLFPYFSIAPIVSIPVKFEIGYTSDF